MSIFDRATEEGLNDAFLEEHAKFNHYIFFVNDGDKNPNLPWGIDYNGVKYVDFRNTDFWEVYRDAIRLIERALRNTHRKGASLIKVRKHIETRHIRQLEKIFFDYLDHGEFLTYKKTRYYKRVNHINDMAPVFAKELSGIYPLYKYKLSI